MTLSAKTKRETGVLLGKHPAAKGLAYIWLTFGRKNPI